MSPQKLIDHRPGEFLEGCILRCLRDLLLYDRRKGLFGDIMNIKGYFMPRSAIIITSLISL